MSLIQGNITNRNSRNPISHQLSTLYISANNIYTETNTNLIPQTLLDILLVTSYTFKKASFYLITCKTG